MKFCCEVFSTHIEEAGRRGFSILACVEDNERFFLIQCRTANDKELPEREDYLLRAKQSAQLFAFETGLQYCPWCGKKLKRVIVRQVEAFDELARLHARYCGRILAVPDRV